MAANSFPDHALIIAHPGHEVRGLVWLWAARPVTYVITDGAGARGTGRVDTTDGILREAGARRGTVFAPLSDAEAYEAIRKGDAAVFCGLAESIAHDLVERAIRSVAGDALEGYNPVHDVCRLMIDAAVTLASRMNGYEIENWAFPLVGAPDQVRAGIENRRTVLDEEVFRRKMDIAMRYRELAPDVTDAIRELGRDSFRCEVFTCAALPAWHDRRFLEAQPFYEIHGEARVQEGKYGMVIRYRDHILPIAAALRELAGSA